MSDAFIEGLPEQECRDIGSRRPIGYGAPLVRMGRQRNM